MGGQCLASALLMATVTATFAQPPADAPFLNPDLTAHKRAADIVARLTLEEMVLQMQSTAPAIPRLGVPAYNSWNEALHGVVQGRATVFPQAIGLAATWDVDLMNRVAEAISTEARAKYHNAQTRPAPTGPETAMTLPQHAGAAGASERQRHVDSAVALGEDDHGGLAVTLGVAYEETAVGRGATASGHSSFGSRLVPSGRTT
jgi:hypothetical protein